MTEEEQKQNKTGASEMAVPVFLLLLTETTGSAGGGIPPKSFSFKHRAKRAANSQPYDEGKLPLEWGIARLRAVGQVMQVK